jgi:uncharacterized protein
MNRPTVPLSQFVLKVHSRCDLACDHCYVYEGADQSWRGRPKGLADEVIAQAAVRIAEHAAAHRLDAVQVILHGGEPLLAGVAGLRQVITKFQSALRDICLLDLRIHSNGVLLNEKFCELFAAHGVKVGISLDGDQSANDRHRRYADGRSSYAQAVRAIGLLRAGRFRDLYAGLLCTIDVNNDPLAVYHALTDLDPPSIDFLLPHATWDNPPSRPQGTDSEYADWLITIFDRWTADGRSIRIRTFESIISTLSGGGSLTEALGLGPSNLVVIETDGTYEQADSLKTAFDGAPVTGYDVFRHALDVVGRHPGIVARQQGRAGLSRTCQECPVVTSCGGGLYAHRYRTGTAFANPSVYCADLLRLITHIRDQLPWTASDPAATPPHGVSHSDFRALAAGFGDAAAMAPLAEAQRSLQRALLSTVYSEASAAAIPASVRADLRTAWTVLTTIEKQPHQARTVAAVLSHPYVRVWAMQCLQQLRDPAAGRGDDDRLRREQELATKLGYFGAIAAVAAIRAGTSAHIAIPIRDGAVHLPTLGRLVLDRAEPPADAADGCPESRATVDVRGGATTVTTDDGQWTLATTDLIAGRGWRVGRPADRSSADWQPVRMLHAPGISVALEDTDPYRDCHRWAAAPRLPDAEFARWQQHFLDAWQLIQREHGPYASALAAGLGTLTPLAAGPEGRDISAAARDAFGAVAVALPADPQTLALLLIHEFQHVKLGAILDLYDLYDPADSRLFPMPWRDDPRPLEGLLQEAYARLARSCADTRTAIDTLADSGSLTPLGKQFVDEMRHSACP